MKKQFSLQAILCIAILTGTITILTSCGRNENKVEPEQQVSPAPVTDSLAFGDSKWISNGLKGKIVFLPENTTELPDFRRFGSQGTLYATALNIPSRDWKTGFPGIPN